MAVIFNKKYNCYYIDRRIKLDNGEIKHISYLNTKDPRFKKKKFVQEFEREFIKTKKDAVFLNNQISFKDFTDKYLEKEKIEVRHSSYNAINSIIKNHFIPFFGKETPIKQCFNQEKVNEFKIFIFNKKFSTNRKNKILSKLREIIEFASVFDYIDPRIKDKCIFILSSIKEEKRKQESKNKYTSYDDYLKIIDVLKKENDSDKLTIISCLYFSGCRIGEFLGIKVEDLTFLENGNIQVNINKQREEIGRGTAPLKTESSYRTILFMNDIADLIKDYIKRNKIGQKDFLFDYYRSSFRRLINDCMEKADIKHNTLHGFGRKSINTEIFKITKNPKACQSILGHKSVEINLNTYVDDQENKKEGYDAIKKLAIIK